jgi:predicted NBD/HSP70 family sugar kinase
MNFVMYVHPSDLRLANTRRVYRSLLAAGSSSRAQLARRTGLSAVTTGKVIDQLIGIGLVEEFEQDATQTPGMPIMGRPPRQVCLSRKLSFVAIELGAKESTVASLSLSGVVNPSTTLTAASPKKAAQLIEEIRAHRETVSPPPPLAVLVSVPGVLDDRANRVLFSPNLHWTEGTELLSGLGALWNVPVVAVQEVQALALGHQASGDVPDSFLLIEFSDGVGGAVVTNGRLLESPFPLSGEIGHTGVPGNSRICGCGGEGCLETLCNRPGLLQSYRDSFKKPRATWNELVTHVQSHGVESWLRDAIDAAALIIGGAVNLLGLREVVAIGELPNMHPDIMKMMEVGVRKHALCARFAQVNCRAAPKRRLMGLVVAATDRVLLPEPSLVTTRPAAAAI